MRKYVTILLCLALTIGRAFADGPGAFEKGVLTDFGAPVKQAGTPSNNQVLIFNSTTGVWAAGAAPAGSTTWAQALTNGNISGATSPIITTGQGLGFNSATPSGNQILFGTGGGNVIQIQGPSDKPLFFASGTGQSFELQAHGEFIAVAQGTGGPGTPTIDMGNGGLTSAIVLATGTLQDSSKTNLWGFTGENDSNNGQNITGAIFSPILSDIGVNGSAVAIGMNINPVINFTAGTKTGHYEGLRVNVTETSLPTASGTTNFLARFQAGTTDFFTINNKGKTLIGGTSTTLGNTTAGLTVVNASTGVLINAESYGATSLPDNGNFSEFIGWHAAGSQGAKGALATNDIIAYFQGLGYDNTAFQGDVGSMAICAGGAWTNGVQTPTYIAFTTAPTGALGGKRRLAIIQTGDVVASSGTNIGWSATSWALSTDPTGGADTAFYRHSSTVAGVNQGTGTTPNGFMAASGFSVGTSATVAAVAGKIQWVDGLSASTAANPQIRGATDQSYFVSASTPASGSAQAIQISGGTALAGNGSGGQALLQGGGGQGTGSGGNASVLAGGGGGTSGTGGGCLITAGNGVSTGSGGGVTITAGNGGAGNASAGAATLTGGQGGGLSQAGGAASVSGGAGVGSSSGAGGLASLIGGAGSTASNNNGSGGATISAGAPSGTGSGNVKVQTGFTGASGATAQTMGDRFFVSSQNTTMSTTTATATTLFQLQCPTSNSSGGCMVFYCVEANDGTNWDTVTGSFTISASNKAGTVTATTAAITDESSNVNSGTLTAGTVSTTISTTNVNVRIAPAFTVIVPTTVRTTYSVMCFGKGVTVNPQ